MYLRILTIVVFFAACCFAVNYNANDFAAEVVESSSLSASSPYNDPGTVLGKPSTICKNIIFQNSGALFRVKLVESAYNLDSNLQKVVTTLNPGEYIVVKFNQKVFDYPGNWGGMDFIVYGNSCFDGEGDGWLGDELNMNGYVILSAGHFEEVRVSVSQDGVNWFTYNAGPFADANFPTQAYFWDRENAQWTDKEMDFTKPLDPNLTMNDFIGISAADAIDLYDGSAGGTSYDLQDLAEYDSLAVDPNTGYRWIQYVKFDGYNTGGEIDAVADAAACGDPTHPYPVGDVNRDCRVDFRDVALLTENWLVCSYNCD